jgi:methionyl-tRNA formyltransferase
MKKIIIFGDLPIATKVARFIENNPDTRLAGVVIGNNNPKNNDPWNDELLIHYAEKNQIDVLDLEAIKKSEINYDLGICCRFSKKIPQDIINKFTIGIVNFHGGLLPEFGGLFSVNHTLLSGSPVGGGTLHWIDSGIDTGAVIKRCVIEICDEDTAISIFQKTQIALFENFIEIFPNIISNKIKAKTLKELRDEGFESNYFDKSSLNGLKYIPLCDLDNENSINKIRAFDFPGYEPAYTLINGKKIYLTVSGGMYGRITKS